MNCFAKDTFHNTGGSYLPPANPAIFSNLLQGLPS